MPKLNLDALNMPEADFEIAKEIVKSNGELYATRPRNASGESQYVWRMVAFSLSSKHQHQCIPCSAEFYLGDHYWDKDFKGQARYRDWLNGIADEIVKSVPVTEQPGTIRWARAFGVI